MEDLPLSEEEFKRIEDAERALLNELTIEQRYDLLVSNFIEFQRAIHSAASEYAVRYAFAPNDFDRAAAPTNRTLLNFLSSARAYLDQVRISSLRDVLPCIEEVIYTEYNSRVAYRVMEALRNYSQHRGLPVHTFSFSGEWVDLDHQDDSKGKRMQTAVPSLDPRALARDRGFKKSVLDELTALNKPDFPLLPWVKEYLGSLSTIHSKVRDLHKPMHDEVSSFKLSEALRYCKMDNNNLISNLYAVELEANGRIRTEIYLGRRLENAIETLKATNRPLTRFEAGHIVT